MKNYLFFLVALLVTLCSGQIAHAQDVNYITAPPTFQLAEPMTPDPSTVPAGAFVTPMRVGDRAISPGVLYSLEANAWLLSEIQRIQAHWILEMNTRVALVLTWAGHELQSQQNRHDASVEILRTQLGASYRNVEDINNINRRLAAQVGWTRREKFRFVISVVGVGAIAGVGGYFLGRIAR